MSFLLSTSFLTNNFLTTSDLTPITSTYSNIKIYGNAIIDDVHLLNYIMSETQISENVDFYIEPEFDNDTLLLSRFNNNLNAGNISFLTEPVTGWKIGRRRESDLIFEEIETVLNPILQSYEDITVNANDTYIYSLSPVTQNYIGSSVLTNEVDVIMNSWFLISLDGNSIYNMCFNFTSTVININESFSQNETFGKFDVTGKSNRQFNSSHISFIPSSVNGINEIIQSVDYIKELENFIQNNEMKYLKSPKGEIWKVITYGFNKSLFSDSDYTQTYIVDFDWIEVAEI